MGSVKNIVKFRKFVNFQIIRVHIQRLYASKLLLIFLSTGFFSFQSTAVFPDLAGSR
jgi:hypothetical protein